MKIKLRNTKLFYKNMTREELKQLKDILEGKPFLVRQRLQFFIESAVVDYTITRTGQQNRALHLYYKLLAQELNDAGHSVQMVVKKKMDLDWNPRLVKELLWRPAQLALLGKQSTTELSKQEEIDTVFEHLNRHLGEKFGIHVPFPNEEEKPAYKLTVKDTGVPYPEFPGEPLV